MIDALARRILGAPRRDQKPGTMLSEIATGGGRFEKIVFTSNRRVMASVTDRGRTLRLHEAFATAPPEVLRALGKYFSGQAGRGSAESRRLIREYVANSVAAPAETPRRRRERKEVVRPGDIDFIARLRREFDATNLLHFDGCLPAIPIRVSDRMRRRNGHFRADPPEVAISRALLTGAADGEAEHTLRHEMIHLWQWHTGSKPGHGPDFRRWARQLNVHPRARRHVRWRE